VVWLSMAWLLGLGYFCVTEVPEWLASVTLLGHAQGYRAQLALGLASILCCIRLVAVAQGMPRDRETYRVALSVFLVCSGLYLWQCLDWETHVRLFARSVPQWVLAVAFIAALLSVLAALGYSRAFALLLVSAVLLTSANFNPLAVGFPDWRSSELAVAIRDVLAKDNRAPGDPAPLWLTYGNRYPSSGTMAVLMGARALGGVYYYPQPDLWRPLDRKGRQRAKYNRFAITTLESGRIDSRQVDFRTNGPSLLTVFVSPLHPTLWHMGARYALTFGREGPLTEPPLKLLYRSEARGFAIWRIPPPTVADPARVVRSPPER
jgi:hypothetical protein